MSLLAKALARRQPEDAPEKIEGGFIRDSGLWGRRAALMVLALLFASGSYLLYGYFAAKVPVISRLEPKAPEPSIDSTMPMIKVRTPSVRYDPFFDARRHAAKPTAQTRSRPAVPAAASQIRYTGHFYASDPGERWVIFNGKKLHQGDSFEDIGVIEISPDSTEVRFNGKILWLNALTNWPLTTATAQGPTAH